MSSESIKSFTLPHVDITSLQDDLTPPAKRIESGHDLAFFLRSKAYHDLTLWILQLTRSCLPQTQPDGTIRLRRLDNHSFQEPAVLATQTLLSRLDVLIDDTPPDPGPRRFGNVAFRTWFRRVEESIASEIEAQFTPITSEQLRQSCTLQIVFTELRSYLLGAFGSPQRLDYGTGHELSYLAFVGILWKCAYLQPGDEWSIVSGTVQPYLALVRKLIKTYNLEPAGSHGVWGLDDHSFVPYIFGSAQLAAALPATTPDDPPPPMPVEGSVRDAPDPASITEPRSVEGERTVNFYFAAVGFILDVKRGPFFEHSPYLYNISGIKDGWGKINKGMLKMYDAEVLGKFPVVQHFPFGNFWRWEQDPRAPAASAPTVHAVSQPAAASTGRPLKAPSASQQPAVKPTQVASRAVHGSSGQSTRAPWVSQQPTYNSAAQATTAPWTSQQPTSDSAAQATRAPWASQQPTPDSTVQATRAPWASQQPTPDSTVQATRAPWASQQPALGLPRATPPRSDMPRR